MDRKRTQTARAAFRQLNHDRMWRQWASDREMIKPAYHQEQQDHLQRIQGARKAEAEFVFNPDT